MYRLFDKVFDRLLRLPRITVFLVLALSFVYGGMFDSMQLASYTAELFGISFNAYAAAAVFGIFSWLVFELVITLYFWLVRTMMADAGVNRDKAAMANILRWFFAAGNTVCGSVRLCYFSHPLAIPLTENVLIFALNLTVLILYYFYIRKKYIAPQLYPRSVAAFCAPYLMFLAAGIMASFAL